MTDHPVLIPTSEGPVGGIVSEPEGPARAGLVLLPGWGRPARSGINSFWTRLARSFAEQGIVVLRFDYSREGETLPIGEGRGGQRWKRDFDIFLLDQILIWFRRGLGELDLLLAGTCAGARAAVEIAGRDPGAVAGTFLIAPHLQILAAPEGQGSPQADDQDAIDPLLIDCFRLSLAHHPTWILVGEHDSCDVQGLKLALTPSPHALEVEGLDGVALHFLDQPHLQAQAHRWLESRIHRALRTV